MANRNGSEGEVNLKIEAQLQQEENNSLVKSNSTNNNPIIANTITTTAAVITNTSIRVESTTPPLVSTAIGVSSFSESERRTVNFGYLPSHQYARYSSAGFSAPLSSPIQSRAPRLRACLVYVDDNGVIFPPRTARIIQNYPYLGYNQLHSSHHSSHQASAPYQQQYSSYISAPPPNLVSMPPSNNINWYSNPQSTSSFNLISTSTTPQRSLNPSDYTFGGVNGIRLVEPRSINAPRSSQQSQLVPAASSSSTSAQHQNNPHPPSTTQTSRPLMNHNEATASTNSGNRGAYPSSNHKRTRKDRVTFSLTQLAMFKKCFKSNPYMKLSDRDDLAQSLNLTTDQVTNWFTNQRRKLKKNAKRKANSNSEHVYN